MIVFETENGSMIEAMEPTILPRLVADDAIGSIAAEARERLARALQAVEAAS